MKNLYLFALSFFLVIGFAYKAEAQKKKNTEEGPRWQTPNVPIDAKTKLINYTKFVQTIGTKSEVAEKCNQWVHSYFKNPYGITKEKTDDKIVCQPRIQLNNPPDEKTGVESRGPLVIYTVTILFKDGGYEYSISDMFQQTASKLPIEKWTNKEDQLYTDVWDYFLIQVDGNMKETIKNLNEFMK